MLFLHGGHHLHEFIHIGPNYNTGSLKSAAIIHGPVLPDGSPGYDGQFNYYLAVDPLNARYYIDFPSYRIGRIVYPLAARALALGSADRVAAALVLVNLVAIPAGTLALAAWLRRRGVSPWLAVVYGLYPGQLLALERDTGDALAAALAAVAVYLRDRSLLLGGAAFAIAGLTRETMVIFPAVFLVSDLVRRRRVPEALAAGAVGIAPVVLWKLWLWRSVGYTEEPIGANFTPIPLAGPGYWLQHLNASAAPEFAGVVVPALIALGAAVYVLARRQVSPEAALTVLTVAAGVVFVSRFPYAELVASARTTIAVALAGTMLVAVLKRREWWWLCAGLWLSPLVPLLAPT